MADETLREVMATIHADSVAKGFWKGADAEALPAFAPTILDFAHIAITVGALFDRHRKTGLIDMPTLTAAMNAIGYLHQQVSAAGGLLAAPHDYEAPNAAAIDLIRRQLHLASEVGETLDAYLASGCETFPLEESADQFIVWADANGGDGVDAQIQAIDDKVAKNRTRAAGYGRFDTQAAPTAPDEETAVADPQPQPRDPNPADLPPNPVPSGSPPEEPLKKVWSAQQKLNAKQGEEPLKKAGV